MESYPARRRGGATDATPGQVDFHSTANVRFSRSARANRAKIFSWRGQKWKTGRATPPDKHPFLTAFRIFGAVREHVADVVFLSERRGRPSTCQSKFDLALPDTCSRRMSRRFRARVRDG